LIREFKDTRAVDENITVKLKGFKSVLHTNPETTNHVPLSIIMILPKE
jgi:hypothetical protein